MIFILFTESPWALCTYYLVQYLFLGSFTCSSHAEFVLRCSYLLFLCSTCSSVIVPALWCSLLGFYVQDISHGRSDLPLLLISIYLHILSRITCFKSDKLQEVRLIGVWFRFIYILGCPCPCTVEWIFPYPIDWIFDSNILWYVCCYDHHPCVDTIQEVGGRLIPRPHPTPCLLYRGGVRLEEVIHQCYHFRRTPPPFPVQCHAYFIKDFC